MSIAKIDVDIRLDKALLQDFIKTRKAIIETLGLILNSVAYQKTKKGYHFWFTIEQELTNKQLCDLQFLLGDDQNRCKFNYLRLEANCFKQFNVLFSWKEKKGGEK
jgi:hypothetical protein